MNNHIDDLINSNKAYFPPLARPQENIVNHEDVQLEIRDITQRLFLQKIPS